MRRSGKSLWFQTISGYHRVVLICTTSNLVHVVAVQILSVYFRRWPAVKLYSGVLTPRRILLTSKVIKHTISTTRRTKRYRLPLTWKEIVFCMRYSAPVPAPPSPTPHPPPPPAPSCRSSTTRIANLCVYATETCFKPFFTPSPSHPNTPPSPHWL